MYEVSETETKKVEVTYGRNQTIEIFFSEVIYRETNNLYRFLNANEVSFCDFLAPSATEIWGSLYVLDGIGAFLNMKIPKATSIRLERKIQEYL